MAYDTDNSPSLIAQKNGSNGAAVWVLKSTDDFETVTANGYITNGDDLGMKVGDQILVIDSDTGASRFTSVAAVTDGGAADLAGEQQELTATAAVNAGAQIVELNHASVVIAATIADFAAHQGIFIVKNTSASGTAAHTLTLTAGTFDGTNTVATLNAPAELLIVFVDGGGDGTIIQNTGSVALS